MVRRCTWPLSGAGKGSVQTSSAVEDRLVGQDAPTDDVHCISLVFLFNPLRSLLYSICAVNPCPLYSICTAILPLPLLNMYSSERWLKWEEDRRDGGDEEVMEHRTYMAWH